MKRWLSLVFIFSVQVALAQQFRWGVNTNLLFWELTYPDNKGQVGLPDWQYQEKDILVLNFQATFTYYHPLLKINDGKYTVGPCLNAAVGYLVNYELDISGALTLDFPQYAMIRYGAGSSEDEDEGFGAGIGIGYTRELIPFPLGTPVACVELFYNNFSLRIGTDLSNRYLYAYHSSEGLVPELTYRELIILFSFEI